MNTSEFINLPAWKPGKGLKNVPIHRGNENRVQRGVEKTNTSATSLKRQAVN